MKMRTASACLLLAMAPPASLQAQQAVVDGRFVSQRAELEVRTFTLRQLAPMDAASLVSPYIVSPDGGVYAPNNGGARAITVRETARVLARIDSVLAMLDRPRPTVRLRFQLIAAQEQGERDPRIASLDSTLRDLFRFRSYRLLAQTAVAVGEWKEFAQSFGAEDQQLYLSGVINAVTTDADSARVSLEVTLSRPPVTGDLRTDRNPASGARVLSTGLSIPIGQTVVLGSGASGKAIQALILVVTPELQGTTKR